MLASCTAVHTTFQLTAALNCTLPVTCVTGTPPCGVQSLMYIPTCLTCVACAVLAGHCLYIKPNGGWASSIDVYCTVRLDTQCQSQEECFAFMCVLQHSGSSYSSPHCPQRCLHCGCARRWHVIMARCHNSMPSSAHALQGSVACNVQRTTYATKITTTPSWVTSVTTVPTAWDGAVVSTHPDCVWVLLCAQTTTLSGPSALCRCRKLLSSCSS